MPPATTSFVPGYEWDIFISYAHTDNEEHFGKFWVSDFSRDLQTAIRSRLGLRVSEIRIFRDQEVFKGSTTLEQLLPAARSSAIFLAICSPSYAARDWTKDEVKAFATAHADPSRLFAIAKLPVDSDRCPPELRSKVPRDFWKEKGHTRTISAISLEWEGEMYRDRVEELASEIAEKLEQLHKVAPAKLTSPVSATAAKPAPTGLKTVLLAMTFDEQKRLNKLKNSLLEAANNIRVVYAGDFPLGGADFKARFTEAIQEADLMVQILGDTPGITNSDVPEGYTSLQMELAKQYKVPTYQWRSPGLDLSEIEDENYLKMLQAESVEVTSLDQLREKILDFARKPAPSVNVEPSPEAVLFINAHSADRALAESIKAAKAAFPKQVKVVFSPTMYESVEPDAKEVRKDLTSAFRESDLLVFLYRKSERDWLKSQYAFLEKLRGYQINSAAGNKRLKPKKLGVVYIGPPSDKPVQVSLPYVDEVTCPENGDLEPLLKLIREALA